MSESDWAPTPGGETVGTIQKQCASYVLQPTDTEVLERALFGMRRAFDRINARNWNWALTYDDIPFRVATDDDFGTDYPLTSWFKAPYNFEIWDTANNSIGKLKYEPWKLFLSKYQDRSFQWDPICYSCPNVHALGTVTLNAKPTEGWVSTHPNGRIWYYRYAQYPVASALGSALDVPSAVAAFVYEFACGLVADTYAVAKAQAAYGRARDQFALLVKDDNDVRTDWS